MANTGLFKNILIPFDGSSSSKRALDVGISMAKAFDAKVALVSIEEYMAHFSADMGEVKDEKERQNTYFKGIQREAREIAKLQGIDFDRADILTGHVSQSIISHAKAIQCDLIVMGHSGRSGVWGTFLGTTAEKVSRYAHCTVVIVR